MTWCSEHSETNSRTLPSTSPKSLEQLAHSIIAAPQIRPSTKSRLYTSTKPANTLPDSRADLIARTPPPPPPPGTAAKMRDIIHALGTTSTTATANTISTATATARPYPDTTTLGRVHLQVPWSTARAVGVTAGAMQALRDTSDNGGRPLIATATRKTLQTMT